MDGARDRGEGWIWVWAAGYFACYVPYSALTKALSEGRLPGVHDAVAGPALLATSTVASVAAMLLVIATMGGFARVGRRAILGVRVPMPRPATFVSGLAAAAIIATTTLAYAVDGASIVLMMLLMRGGVLVIAPIVDVLSRRRVRAASWAALALSLGAIAITIGEGARGRVPPAALVVVAVYLAGYVVRLRLMSRASKSDDRDAMLRYFVEEQLVAAPALLVALVAWALFGRGDVARSLADGLAAFASPGAALWVALLVGVLSEGTGVFGGLVLLDARENTFCVPVNRASSMLAGVVATAALALLGAGGWPPASQLVGVALVIGAIAVLAAPSRRGSGAPVAAR